MVSEDKEDFIRTYPFSENDQNLVSAMLLRAFDNAVVLRDELSSKTLSYIRDGTKTASSMQRIAGTCLRSSQPVIDDLFAFWGCLDDNVEDEECRNIIKCGKYLERLDLVHAL